MRLSEYIKTYRITHDLSLRAFSQMCGCSYQYIDRIEKGTIEKPSAKMLQKLAKGMGMSIQELLTQTDEIAKPYKSNSSDTLPDHFDTAEQAVLWLADMPVLAFYGGDDIHKLDPETQLEFAREVLEYMKYLSGRKKGAKQK